MTRISLQTIHYVGKYVTVGGAYGWMDVLIGRSQGREEVIDRI